jgi:hypothetical protein
MIHLAWHECDQLSPCHRTVVRVLRVPVTVEGNRIIASSDPKQGFLDCRFGSEDKAATLVLPMLTVNKSDDMVVAYERVSSSERISTGVRLRVWYHNHAHMSEAAWIKKGEKVPHSQTIPAPPGGVDLGGIDVDPDDHETIWMSHAFGSSSGGFQEVITAVKP